MFSTEVAIRTEIKFDPNSLRFVTFPGENPETCLVWVLFVLGFSLKCGETPGLQFRGLLPLNRVIPEIPFLAYTFLGTNRCVQLIKVIQEREKAEQQCRKIRNDAEVSKMFLFRRGMKGLSDAYLNYSQNTENIFRCHRFLIYCRIFTSQF